MFLFFLFSYVARLVSVNAYGCRRRTHTTAHDTIFPKGKHAVLNCVLYRLSEQPPLFDLFYSTTNNGKMSFNASAHRACVFILSFHRVLTFNCLHTYVRMLGCLLCIYALVIKQTKGTPKKKKNRKKNMPQWNVEKNTIHNLRQRTSWQKVKTEPNQTQTKHA